MDIIEIDAVNFAGRVAHVAAAELAGLLAHGEVAPIAAWFAGGVSFEADADMSAEVDGMAAYVVQRQAGGEQLYRFRGAGAWPDEAPEIRAAFDLFSSTVRTVAAQITERQRAAERALDLATRPAPAPVKLEDTIFETEDSLGKLRPEAVDARTQIAAYDRAQADARAEAGVGALETPSEGTTQEARRAQPMSIGEAPPAPPVNRGGRGRRKEG